MNDVISKNIGNYLKSSDLGGSRELNPGELGRRYEPIGGLNKHNERIHRESRQFDKYSKLPFEFSKPKKSLPDKTVKCLNCGNITRGTSNTVGIICTKCNVFSKVEEVVYE